MCICARVCSFFSFTCVFPKGGQEVVVWVGSKTIKVTSTALARCKCTDNMNGYWWTWLELYRHGFHELALWWACIYTYPEHLITLLIDIHHSSHRLTSFTHHTTPSTPHTPHLAHLIHNSPYTPYSPLCPLTSSCRFMTVTELLLLHTAKWSGVFGSTQTELVSEHDSGA